MKVLLFDKFQMYPITKTWWQARDNWIVPKDLLPNIGAMAWDEDEFVAAGWLYLYSSRGAQIGWIVSNPKCGPKRVSKAIGLVVRYLENRAIEKGARAIMCMSSSRGLTRKYKRLDYAKMNTNHDMCIKMFTGEVEG